MIAGPARAGGLPGHLREPDDPAREGTECRARAGLFGRHGGMLAGVGVTLRPFDALLPHLPDLGGVGPAAHQVARDPRRRPVGPRGEQPLEGAVAPNKRPRSAPPRRGRSRRSALHGLRSTPVSGQASMPAAQDGAIIGRSRSRQHSVMSEGRCRRIRTGLAPLDLGGPGGAWTRVRIAKAAAAPARAPEEVRLPGHAGPAGQHAPDHRAVERAHQQRRPERRGRAVHEPSRHEEAEPPEDEAGGADVDGRAAEDPDPRAPRAPR